VTELVSGGPPASLTAHPALSGPWHRVAARSYGTTVWRVGDFYVKTTPHADPTDARFSPVAEAARLSWLHTKDFAVPEVIEQSSDDTLHWLITTAVPGRPASASWPASQWPAVVATVAETVASLHELTDCPFDGSLPVTLSWAERAAREDLIDLSDVDEEHTGWSAGDLLAKLQARPTPPEDLVVCHGDLGLDNLLLDPATARLTAILDVGRLGMADRWRDLAILLRDLPNGTEFLAQYGTPHDPEKESFYRLLDEFF
jgi:aminoglycoside phosphotransferase